MLNIWDWGVGGGGDFGLRAAGQLPSLNVLLPISPHPSSLSTLPTIMSCHCHLYLDAHADINARRQGKQLQLWRYQGILTRSPSLQSSGNKKYTSSSIIILTLLWWAVEYGTHIWSPMLRYEDTLKSGRRKFTHLVANERDRSYRNHARQSSACSLYYYRALRMRDWLLGGCV